MARRTFPGHSNGENNYYYPGNNTDRFDSEFGRIDVNITTRNKLFYDFRHNDRFHTSGNVFNNVATGSTLISPNWGSTVDDVHVFYRRDGVGQPHELDPFDNVPSSQSQRPSHHVGLSGLSSVRD